MFALLFTACTAPANPGPAVTTLLDVGALLGGEIEVTAPVAGDYRVKLRASQHRFHTRERTQTKARNLYGRLNLLEGRFTLCIWGTERSSSSFYRPGATDRNKKTDHEYPVLHGVEGTWTGEGLRIERSGRCGELTQPLEVPVQLRCVQPTKGPLQGSVLCTGMYAPIQSIGLLSAGTPRDGSWALRNDPRKGQPEFGEGLQPWFVFGPAPGLHLSSDDSDAGDPPVFAMEPGQIPDGPSER